MHSFVQEFKNIIPEKIQMLWEVKRSLVILYDNLSCKLKMYWNDIICFISRILAQLASLNFDY